MMNIDDIIELASETLNEEDWETFNKFIQTCRSGGSIATNHMHADEFIKSLKTEFKREWTKSMMIERVINHLAFDQFTNNDEFFQVLSDYINIMESGYIYYSVPMFSNEDLDDLSLDDMFKDLILTARA